MFRKIEYTTTLRFFFFYKIILNRKKNFTFVFIVRIVPVRTIRFKTLLDLKRVVCVRTNNK